MNDRTLPRIRDAGCEIIREEQKSAAALAGCPQLTTILDFIHADEALAIHRMDLLARSLRDLQAVVDCHKAKGAHLMATEQPVDISAAARKVFFDMLSVFAEFETNSRRDRQAEVSPPPGNVAPTKAALRRLSAQKFGVRESSLGPHVVFRRTAS